jgi:hypothetical protein
MLGSIVWWTRPLTGPIWRNNPHLLPERVKGQVRKVHNDSTVTLRVDTLQGYPLMVKARVSDLETR